jgi:PhnB protein
MTTLTPYLSFSGDCESALETYAEVFGGRTLALLRFKDNVPDVSKELEDRVLHSVFEAPGVRFMASDATLLGPGGESGGAPITVTLALDFADRAEQERVWARLADGGTVLRPLHDTFYEGRLGVLTDRFGITWMLNWAPPDAPRP